MNYKEFKNIEDMSAYLTHSINTPLTYIKGNVEIMNLDLKNLPDSKLKNELIQHQKRILKGIIDIEEVVDVVHSVTINSTAK